MHSLRMICEVVIAVSSARLFFVATNHKNDAGGKSITLPSAGKTAKESMQGPLLPDNSFDFHQMQDLRAVRQFRMSTHSRISSITM